MFPVQPGHECFVITGMTNSCYGSYSLLLVFCILVGEEPIYNHTE